MRLGLTNVQSNLVKISKVNIDPTVRTDEHLFWCLGTSTSVSDNTDR